MSRQIIMTLAYAIVELMEKNCEGSGEQWLNRNYSVLTLNEERGIADD